MDEYLRLTPAPGGAVSERMQALLSKAVEEQVHEQREVQSLLSDVRSALAEVQRGAHTAPLGHTDVGADLALHAAETRAHLAQLDERLEAIVKAVGTSAQVLQGISAQLERVVDAVKEQAGQAGRSEPLAQIRHEVGELRGRIDAAAEETARAVANHVDNAVLVLAEALLRRPAPSAAADEPGGGAAPPYRAAEAEAEAEPEPEPQAEPEPEPEPELELERLLDRHPVDESLAAAEHPAAADTPIDAPAFGATVRVPSPISPPPGVDPADWADEAGSLVDTERTADPASGQAEAAPYDDPLADLPSPDDAPSGFPLAAAPYDLERALFGDRSRRPVESPPAKDNWARRTLGDAEPAAQPDAEAAADTDEPAGGDEFDDAPRRRPWWRPNG